MSVHIFEVGPRDGLQNEKQTLSTAVKLEFISGLLDAGLRSLEIGLYVRPDRVPQMADSEAIQKAVIRKKLKGEFWALTPNIRGLERAFAAGAKNIAVFTAATDGFTQNNIGMSVAESLREFKRLVGEARTQKKGCRVRGYISTAFGCPFDGKVNPKRVLDVARNLFELGCDEVSIGDTIGVAVPRAVEAVFRPAIVEFGAKNLAGHFHDTRGTALANALGCLELGVRTIDSSAGGLGGCPFAPGASGNLATEDLVYTLEEMGEKTGVDLKKLARVSLRLARRMKSPLRSRFLQAYQQTGDIRYGLHSVK